MLFGGKEGVTRFKVLPVVHPAASAATDGEPGGSRLTVDWSEIIARSALILPSFSRSVRRSFSLWSRPIVPARGEDPLIE